MQDWTFRDWHWQLQLDLQIFEHRYGGQSVCHLCTFGTTTSTVLLRPSFIDIVLCGNLS